MKTQIAAVVAATIPLLLSSAPGSAAEPQFKAPATARAQESAQLLTLTARAFYDSPSASTLVARGSQVSDLWLYPTSAPDTVFAQYTLGSNEIDASRTRHLAVVTVHESRVVGVRELTESSAGQRVTNERSSGGPHWSAAIGTGHSSESATDRGVTHGVPVSAHWAAAIGTGSTSQDAAREVTSPVQPTQSIAGAHWASKIGTGHASDSNDRPTQAASSVVANTSGRSE